MLLKSVIGILFLIYVRPQEWRPWVANFYPVYLAVACGIIGLFQANHGKITLKQFFRTPHDWLILAFHAWICYADWSPFATTFQVVRIYLVFYFLITQALNKVSDFELFFKWWSGLVLFISVMALASLFGFDPLNGKDIVEGPLQGRLALRLSLFDNPNSLGHSLVPVVPMLFYMLWWRRPYALRVFWPVLSVFPLWALFETKSRGSFVCAGVMLVMGLIMGRSPIIQIVVVMAMISLGPGLITKLPRMDTMSRIKNDAGVTGRMIAFEWGLQKLHKEPKGVGFLKFLPAILREKNYLKDAHSTYVLIGAELGYRGLFLFVGILYCCLRTVAMAKAASDSEERLRRIMFTWIVAYCFSSWMINYSYHPVFLVMVAVIAALHRLFMQRADEQALVANTPAPEALAQRPLLALPGAAPLPAGPFPSVSLTPYRAPGAWSPPGGARPGNAGSAAAAPAGFPSGAPAAAAAPSGPITGPDSLAAQAAAVQAQHVAALRVVAQTWPAKVGIRWRRLGLLDVALMWVGTDIVIRMWKYILYQYTGF